MNPYSVWIAFIVAVNLIGAYLIYSGGNLIGDLTGHPLHSENALLVASFLVVTSYFVLLGPVFSFISKIKIQKLKFGSEERSFGVRFGLLLVVAQVLYVFFNFSNNVNIAGSSSQRADSIFSLFWVLLPVDMLFMVYYGLYRDSKYFNLNLTIWLLSNLLRGWAGVFLAVIFMESCKYMRRKKISVVHVFLIIILVLSVYPFATNLKWLIRASSSTGLTIDSILDGFSSSQDFDFLAMIVSGLEHIIGRLQSVSFLVDVIRLSDLLQSKFMSGDFAPFWMEGLHGIMYEKIIYGQKPVYIGTAFTGYESFNFVYEVGDWNVSLGYMSWFFIAPYHMPIYVAYTFLLAFISFWLMKKIGATTSSKDMLWYSWFAYLLAPWFATFVVFIYALFLFLILKIGMAKFPAMVFVKQKNPSVDENANGILLR